MKIKRIEATEGTVEVSAVVKEQSANYSTTLISIYEDPKLGFTVVEVPYDPINNLYGEPRRKSFERVRGDANDHFRIRTIDLGLFGEY